MFTKQLVYLSMMESGLNPTARSWASAVGLWQFIKVNWQSYTVWNQVFIMMKEESGKINLRSSQDI
ncbi:MAG: transglycosylase SLT domain-containing protein [Ignavibacteriales bacterium]|nr:transglycosylase SLT domain-containing protein [Ignavibacteriales bacterium]